jgi:hypothetical protein
MEMRRNVFFYSNRLSAPDRISAKPCLANNRSDIYLGITIGEKRSEIEDDSEFVKMIVNIQASGMIA